MRRVVIQTKCSSIAASLRHGSRSRVLRSAQIAILIAAITAFPDVYTQDTTERITQAANATRLEGLLGTHRLKESLDRPQSANRKAGAGAPRFISAVAVSTR
jgi:hypothetical protein